jgi:hypothetical protein
MRVYTRWDQELVDEDASEIFHHLALWHLLGVEDEEWVEEALAGLLAGDLKPLLSLDLDYQNHTAVDSAHVRQAQAFFSKRRDLDLGIDRRAVAIAKFLEAENRCRETNELFRSRGRGNFRMFPRVERVLWHASRKISSILGDVPKLSDLRFRFGPGATTQIQKRTASARAKLGQVPACSSELYPAAREVLHGMPGWTHPINIDGKIVVVQMCDVPAGAIPVHHGKIAFVPKSAKEDRSIMVEPSLNTMCQAGIGDYMADRLRSCGVDIRDQTRNQRLARKGSIDGSLATVDLSSASDTISIELVYDLLGLEWASFLARFRTGTALMEGRELRLEKFSSMGNGFTFPLETLIFYALAYGVCVEGGHSTRDVSCYGDDIILPVEAYSLLNDVFTSCGFVVNGEKSFAQGPFRESCGADYYQGIDIRPVYQKDRPCVFDLFRLHNHYYRNYAEDVCTYLVSFLEPSIRLYGPDGYGDGHLLGKWTPRLKRGHLSKGYGGCVFDTFSFKPKRSFQASKGDRVLPVYTTYLTEGQDDRSQLRGCDAVFPYVGASHDVFSVSIPGKEGFNRISIYTFWR